MQSSIGAWNGSNNRSFSRSKQVNSTATTAIDSNHYGGAERSNSHLATSPGQYKTIATVQNFMTSGTKKEQEFWKVKEIWG